MTDSAPHYTLLLVDDNPTNLMLLREIIELDLPEVRALTADSAAAGLKIAEQEAIDGAFVDVQMPRMNGFDVCAAIKADAGLVDTKVVLLTAKGQEVDRQKGADAGADLYLTKPFDPDELFATAERLLGLG